MFIPRHDIKIDLAHSRGRYDYEQQSVREILNILRDPTRSDLLTHLGMSAEAVYDHGLRIGADPAVCAWALTTAARANTAVFVFAKLTDPPRQWQLDQGPPVTFTEPVCESTVHSGRWMEAVQQAVVARQYDCLAELLPISYVELSRSSTRSSAPDRDDHRVEQNRVLAQAALDPGRPLAAKYLLHAAGARPTKMPQVNRRIAEANDQMVNSLDTRDAVSFNTALAESLKLRAVSSQRLNEEYKQNHTVLWPLGLIALVVLAHDRGMPIEVESDYLPRPWVIGEFFRPRT
jgi:hypothetical protein